VQNQVTATEEDEGMADDGGDSKIEKLGLSKAKRQQIFKKHKKKSVQAQILELKAQSKKFKKKDVAQKAEKGKIAKQIKALKASLKKSGEELSSESE
jgi:hypothetical protein